MGRDGGRPQQQQQQQQLWQQQRATATARPRFYLIRQKFVLWLNQTFEKLKSLSPSLIFLIGG